MGRILSASVFSLTLSTLFNVQAAPLSPQHFGDFDQYVLALSWQPGFCQSMQARSRNLPAECQHPAERADKSAWLTLHGLWPSLPGSVAAKGVDNGRWMRFGCSTRPVPNLAEVKPGKKCAAPDTGLSRSVAAQLAEQMPGAGGSSCLERYEYAKHGVCFGFNPDDYFATMVRLNQSVRKSALGQYLASHYGQTVSRDDIIHAIAAAWGNESVNAVKLTCHGNPASLTDVQIALKASAINQPLTAGSFAPGPHPGNCPDTFTLAAAVSR